MTARRVWTMSLAALLGCSGSPAPDTSPPAVDPPVAATPAPDAAVAAEPAPPPRTPIRVASGQSLSLDRSDAIEIVSLAGGDDNQTIVLDVDGDDVELPAGVPVAWTATYRVELAGVDADAGWVDVYVDRVGPDTIAGTERSFRVDRHASAELGDGAALTFVRHGHKSVEKGMTSPLMVDLEYTDAAGNTEEGGAYLFPPEESTWRWRDYQLTLTDYDYGSFMVIDVVRLALSPVEAASGDDEE